MTITITSKDVKRIVLYCLKIMGIIILFTILSSIVESITGWDLDFGFGMVAGQIIDDKLKL